MLRYTDTKIVFREVPDEISLAVNISGCPFACKGCHSSFLQGEVGDELSTTVIDFMLKRNDSATCFLFMGGDGEPAEVTRLAAYIKSKYPRMMTAMYSGADVLHSDINPQYFDFIKIGHFVEVLGGLDSPLTNQRLYKIDKGVDFVDITDRMKSQFADCHAKVNIL